MKLLMCFGCKDIFALDLLFKECGCKQVSGQYLEDALHANVWMPNRKSGTVLGFANSSLRKALQYQLWEGDSKETMEYCGREEVKGRDFTAFIIPESAPTVHRHYHE